MNGGLDMNEFPCQNIQEKKILNYQKSWYCLKYLKFFTKDLSKL